MNVLKATEYVRCNIVIIILFVTQFFDSLSASKKNNIYKYNNDNNKYDQTLGASIQCFAPLVIVSIQ